MSPPPAAEADERDLLQHAVAEAARLLEVDGAMAYLAEHGTDTLRFAADAGIRHPEVQALVRELTLPIGVGMFGAAVERRELVITGDYRKDARFRHSPVTDRIVRLANMRSMVVAPLIADGEALGGLGAYSSTIDAFDEAQVGLLRALADHAAVAIANRRLIERLARSQAELARRVEAQQTLGQIAARIAVIRDQQEVLERVVEAAQRLIGSDGAHLTLLDAEQGVLRPTVSVGADQPTRQWLGEQAFPINRGINGLAAGGNALITTEDYRADPRIPHEPGDQATAERMHLRGMAAAPLRGPEGAVMGTLAVSFEAPHVFTDDERSLLQGLADQGAIAITNARLVEQLRERADAQRSLAEIAAQIAAPHDPIGVLQRSVAHAARLLDADRAQVNLLREGAAHLDPPVAAAPVPPSPHDVVVPIGSGIAGTAAAERRVRWTGEYLADEGFPHDEGDARIRAQGIRSMMAAPLIGPDRLLGTITVQSTRRDAFGADDAELLKLLADQAAIALTNARLYAELGDSERRYRHLVDNSPDIVWSVDADGRFTFFSDSLEPRTGWKPSQLLGRHWTDLTAVDPESRAIAEAGWRRMHDQPSVEQRIRIMLPLPDGSATPVEIAMIATSAEGAFAGAHGSVRDVSERERLEEELRRHAAELAANQERAHLARELHDSVTQALFSMGLTLRTLELLLDSDPDAAGGKVRELRELQRDALAEMRALIFELRPASLETDGLLQALRNHAAAVQGRTGLAVTVDADRVDRLPIPTEEALYRIGQEALHNVVKHANAERATIRLRRDGERVVLTVEDDGSGFSPQAVARGHLGLLGMRQRADLIGGELRVESTPDHGTRVEVSVPADTAAEPIAGSAE
jgi:PAS domain S-box-containing protein